ncbi:hypothetical protein ACFPRL_16365 [Pseudoclavibacter helvolus]
MVSRETSRLQSYCRAHASDTRLLPKLGHGAHRRECHQASDLPQRPRPRPRPLVTSPEPRTHTRDPIPNPEQRHHSIASLNPHTSAVSTGPAVDQTTLRTLGQQSLQTHSYMSSDNQPAMAIGLPAGAAWIKEV